VNSNTSQSQQLRRIATAAMRARGLEPEFSAAVVQQSNAITKPSDESGPAIRDLRALLWSSIDNDESRDLDQIEYVESQGDGAVKVLVAIADVDSLVKVGTPIDEHAHFNTTSVYTAVQIFPMLPEKLSTDLTSLAEDQERLSVVMEMIVAPDGTLRESSVYRARVVNRAKLA
jgi:exoribonuclease II